MIEEAILKNEERAILKLRSLYKKYGYMPFKMSKFEEYDLYVRNKDFLISDRVITFNDTNGKLLALKPDVTLSIIKNGDSPPGLTSKRGPGLGSFSRADRGIGGVQHVAPPTWLVSNFLVRPASS